MISDEPEWVSAPPDSGIPAPRLSWKEAFKSNSKVIAPLEQEPTLKLKWKNFTETYFAKNELEFIIEDCLPRGGLMFLGALSGTGKTILALQLVINLIKGEDTLHWKTNKKLNQLSVVMLSLEMTGPELQVRLKDMYPMLGDTDRKLITENFHSYSEAEPLKLSDDQTRHRLINDFLMLKPDICLLDSASVGLAPTLTNEELVNKGLENLRIVRMKTNTAFIVVSHTRKPDRNLQSAPEDMSINELFGHSGIAQHASSIFLMMEDEAERKITIKNKTGDRDDKTIHIMNVKSRFGASNAAYRLKFPARDKTKKGTPLQFRDGTIALGMSQEAKRQAAKEAGIMGGFSGLGSIIDQIATQAKKEMESTEDDI